MRLYNATMKINRLEMLKANIGLELIAGHDELERFMAGILKDRTEEELARQAGILGKTVRNNAQLAHAIPNGSFHNANFSDRIWLYQDLMKADLDKLLQNGLIQGKNPRQLARELEKYVMEDATGGAKYRALTLMQTELARVQTEAQKQSFERNGFDEYTFHANSGCCGDCQALDGKHFKVKDMMPGKNAAPMHPRCRCSSSAYSDRAEYEEWLDFLEKGGTTEEYNKLKAAGKLPKKETKPAAQPKMPKSIADTEDFETLDNYLKKEYNVSVEKSVKDLSFKPVLSVLTGCESVISEFPRVAKTLKALVTSKSGVMSCGVSSGKISFNPHYFSDDKKLIADCERMSKSRWLVPNSSPASIGAHETGHAVEWLMIESNKSYMYEWQRIDAWNKCTEAKGVVSQACKNIKKTEYGKGKRNAELISGISRYGQENASETMAEAFADVYANGENANPLSLEIMRLTKEKLKTYEGSESE
jgi:SPP1 gp7 family putative phage head morphogenesis protein